MCCTCRTALGKTSYLLDYVTRKVFCLLPLRNYMFWLIKKIMNFGKLRKDYANVTVKSIHFFCLFLLFIFFFFCDRRSENFQLV